MLKSWVPELRVIVKEHCTHIYFAKKGTGECKSWPSLTRITKPVFLKILGVLPIFGHLVIYIH